MGGKGLFDRNALFFCVFCVWGLPDVFAEMAKIRLDQMSEIFY